jgi:hypothetical protein
MMTRSQEDFVGMSANERLFVTGQLDAFDQAVAERNLPKVREILESVFIDETAIRLTTGNVEAWGTAHDPTVTIERL